MTNTTDAARRRLIVQQCEPTPVSPHGVRLNFTLSLHKDGSGFINTQGADDLSCGSDLVVIAELAKLIELLRREQLKRERA